MNLKDCSKIAAVVALVFVCSSFVICSDDADAYEPTADQYAEVYTAAIFKTLAENFYDYPSDYATVLSGTVNVDKEYHYGDVVLKDGTVLNFSKSAVIYADTVFIEGNVKIVNKGSYDDTLFIIEGLCLDNVKVINERTGIFLDGTASISVKSNTSGFYDPLTDTHDFSKGIKGSLSADIVLDKSMDIYNYGSLYDGAVIKSNGSSPAFSISGSMDLTDLYNSVTAKLKGAQQSEIQEKMLDYVYNNLVYPYIDVDVFVSDVDVNKSYQAKGVNVSLESSPSKKMISCSVDVSSASGPFECKDLKMGVNMSLLKAEIFGEADEFRFSGSGDYAIGLDLEDMSYSVSMRGDKFMEMMSQYNQYSTTEEFIKAISSSDMYVSGAISYGAGAMSGTIMLPLNDGTRAKVECSFESLEFDAEVDSKTGSTVKGSADSAKMSMVTNNSLSYDASYKGYYMDATVNGKNVLTFLKYIPISSSYDYGGSYGYGSSYGYGGSSGYGSSSQVDYEALIFDVLDGLEFKGDIGIGELSTISNYGTAGSTYYTNEKVSISGDSNKNISLDVDVAFSANSTTGIIKATGDYDLDFSNSAVVKYDTVKSDSSGFNGVDMTMKEIAADVQDVVIEGQLSDFLDSASALDTASLRVDMESDIDMKVWSSQGTAAYGERMNMDDVNLVTTLQGLSSVLTGEIPEVTGGDIEIDSYKVTNRGTDVYLAFNDLVAKADSSSVVSGTNFEYQKDESADSNMYIGGTTVTIGGNESKYTAVSKETPVAYLSKNAAGYYDVVETSDSSSGDIPIYNIESKAGNGGDNTILYIAIAVIAIILVALAAFFLLKKRGSKA